MSKDEFIELAGIKWDDISEEDYELVEYVYARHPAINSKQDIANLWKLPNSMMIIRDMVETATLYEKIEQNYYSAMNKANKARQAMEDIKLGRIQYAKEYLNEYWKEEFPEPEE